MKCRLLLVLMLLVVEMIYTSQRERTYRGLRHSKSAPNNPVKAKQAGAIKKTEDYSRRFPNFSRRFEASPFV